ncbi:hypothetical protein ACFXG4_48490 [Nocardia sp. NPDC059246]|uniref:hypothetical protein n=1 Tax=unclassified Nocardia TaxID=2637762 RepID=UPI0036A46BAD
MSIKTAKSEIDSRTRELRNKFGLTDIRDHGLPVAALSVENTITTGQLARILAAAHDAMPDQPPTGPGFTRLTLSTHRTTRGVLTPEHFSLILRATPNGAVTALVLA